MTKARSSTTPPNASYNKRHVIQASTLIEAWMATVNEIERTNHIKVENVHIMTNVKYTRVRFSAISSGNKIKEPGLGIFSFSIQPRQLEFERFTAVNHSVYYYGYTHNKSRWPK